MFGVGPSELVIVFLMVLLLFGPSKLPQMARDIGRFVGEARRSIDEFKEELTTAGEDEERNKAPDQQRRKNSPARKEKEPEETASTEGSAETSQAREEEYDF